MRILMISDVYFPRVNGVSTSIQTFARGLVACGHEVTLIAPDYGARGGQGQTEPFEVLRLASRYLPLDPEDRMLRPGRVRALLGTGNVGLKGRGFDLVHIQTPFVAHYTGLSLARRLGVPVVESYHTFFEQYLDSYVPLIPSAWLRLAARRFSASQGNAVDALVVPSEAMRQVLEAYGVRTPIRVIPTGIEAGRLPPGDGAGFRRAHGIAETRPVLVHVGRIAFEKNIGFLLQVLARLILEIPDLLLVVAGEGPARAALQAQSVRLGLADHTRFIGYLERGQPLADCYCAGDAFVFASRTETQGLVLLEALALGVPVVSTAVMGTREVLAQGRGCLIAEEDEAHFASQVLRLLKDPGLRRHLGAEASAYALEWSAPALTARMLDFYRETLTGVGAGQSALP
jgi:1,2-diacylglycerol 3-alpha-glucosyltransferase